MPVTYAYKNGDTREREIEVANDLPFIEGFANSIGVHRDTLHEWTKRHPEFSDAYKRAKQLQRVMLWSNGLKGLYAQPYAILTTKNITDWRDQKDIDLKTDNTHKIELSEDDRRNIKELAKQMAISKCKGK
jgi:hypothetical protein